MATQLADAKDGEAFQVDSANPTFNYNGAGSQQLDPADPYAGTKVMPPGDETLVPQPAPTEPVPPLTVTTDCGCTGGKSPASAPGGSTEIEPTLPTVGPTIVASEGALSGAGGSVSLASNVPLVNMAPNPLDALAFLKTGTGLLLLAVLLILANSKRNR